MNIYKPFYNSSEQLDTFQEDFLGSRKAFLEASGKFITLFIIFFKSKSILKC